MHDQDMDIELSDGARELLAKRGYDPVLGARPLRRTIQRDIEDAISEQILFGAIKPGDTVRIDVEGEGDDQEFTFDGKKHVTV